MDLIELVSPHAVARITPHGAQVLEAEFDGVPLLWLSPLARPDTDQVIRGGVPLCFPWFSKHPAGLPSHGFARNQPWTVLSRSASEVAFELRDNAASRALWPHAFRASLTVSLDTLLRFDFQVENLDDASFSFSYALHSYFAVPDCRQCEVTGLAGRLRREVGHVTTPQQGTVSLTEPIDAIFEIAPEPLTLLAPHQQVHIAADGMRSAVVWNPGSGAEAIPDIGCHWPEYVCVERGNIGTAAITLAPGELHRASMQLGLQPAG